MKITKEDLEEGLSLKPETNIINAVEKMFLGAIIQSCDMDFISETISTYNDYKKEMFPDGISIKDINNISKNDYAFELEEIIRWMLGEVETGAKPYWFRNLLRNRFNDVYEKHFPETNV